MARISVGSSDYTDAYGRPEIEMMKQSAGASLGRDQDQLLDTGQTSVKRARPPTNWYLLYLSGAYQIIQYSMYFLAPILNLFFSQFLMLSVSELYEFDCYCYYTWQHVLIIIICDTNVCLDCCLFKLKGGIFNA